MFRIIRTGLFCGVLALMAGSAAAVPVTIAFDSFSGAFDPNAPIDPLNGPSAWLEGGARVDAFWLTNAGTPSGSEILGHLHLVGENDSVFPLIGERAHAWANDLQGLTISLDDPFMTFDLVSVDYRIEYRDTPPGFETVMERLDWSYATNDTRLLVSGTPLISATPDFASFEAQFTAVAIDDGSIRDNGDGSFDPNRPADDLFRTAVVGGFQNLTSLQLSHTGGIVWIDNIVLDVRTTPIPEPGTALLFGIGLVGLTVVARRIRR